MIGQVVNRYRIESKIGEGGMGVVYKAHDTSLDWHVAIKVLPHDRVADPARKQRFVLEARAASALNHPGIVTVHDIASDAGVDFIVMELVSGRTLDQVIGGRGLSVARALRYTEGRGAASSAVLWRIPVAGGAPVRIADGVVAGAFDVVPGGVYYLERLPGESRLQFFDAGSQAVITVARNLGNVEFFALGASRDGRAIYFTRIDASVNDLMLVEGFR